LFIAAAIAKMRAMSQEIPATLTYSFYGLVAWGLSALFVAFRALVGEDLKRGIYLRLGVIAWMGVPAVLSINGAFLDLTVVPPLLMRTVLLMGLLIVVFSFSPWGRRAAQKIPDTLLVGSQIFRLPLELVLYGLGARAILPQEMTFQGYNFDIVTGVLALPLWLLLHTRRAPRWALWVWNVTGIALLLIIVGLAVAAFPVPFGLFEPPNLLVAFYPWVWLPAFLVQIALLSHLLMFRKLMIPPPPPGPNI